MTDQATINSLSKVKDMFLHESLAILVRNHGPDDIVSTLATVMDEYAITYARRTGDYDGASAMKLISDYLDGLDEYVENFDRLRVIPWLRRIAPFSCSTKSAPRLPSSMARMDREFSELTDRVRRIDERLDGLVAQVTRIDAQVTEGFKR